MSEWGFYIVSATVDLHRDGKSVAAPSVNTTFTVVTVDEVVYCRLISSPPVYHISSGDCPGANIYITDGDVLNIDMDVSHSTQCG